MPNPLFLPNQRPAVAARLTGAPGYESIRGQVLFYPAPGGTIVVTQVRGLPAGRFFAMHIHQGSSCQPLGADPFGQAGGHWGPPPHPEHWGDLPVLLSSRGYAWSAVYTGQFRPEQAKHHTVILHRNPDDYRTQPAGNAGDRIACGVIR